MKIDRKHIFRAAALVSSLVACEVLLHLACLQGDIQYLLADDFTRSDLRPGLKLEIEDSVLGHRLNPKHPEHDSAGWRNPTIPDQVDIVCLGDSQTYGTNVDREAAWPSQLQKITGKRVYNMGVSGWAAPQSAQVISEALALNPKVVVFAIYAGNDAVDSWRFRQLVLDKSTLEKRTAFESQDEANNPDFQNAKIAWATLMGEEITVANASKPSTTKQVSRFNSTRRLFSEHSKLFGILRLARQTASRLIESPIIDPDVSWQEAKQEALGKPHNLEIFEADSSQAKTILSPHYRSCTLASSDERISTGILAMQTAIEQMATSTKAQGAKFIAIKIPTKESVFYDAYPATEYSESMQTLVVDENIFWNKIDAHLDTLDIPSLDIKPALVHALATEIELVYYQNADGHPAPNGHRCIAEALNSLISNSDAATPVAQQD